MNAPVSSEAATIAFRAMFTMRGLLDVVAHLASQLETSSLATDRAGYIELGHILTLCTAIRNELDRGQEALKPGCTEEWS